MLTNPFQLDEEGLKEKKKQKLMKAGYEARIRARKEKEREREEKEREEKREEEERENDLVAWSKRLRSEQEARCYLVPYCSLTSSTSVGNNDAHQRAHQTQSRTERQKECCCSGSNEEHCQPGKRRPCPQEETQRRRR